MKIVPVFYKYPFVYIFCFFAAGIFSYYFNPSFQFIEITGALAILSLLVYLNFKKQLQYLYFFFIGLSFTCLGALTMNRFYDENFEKLEKSENSTYILRIDEFQQKPQWSKGIAHVYKEQKNGDLIQTKKRILFFAQSKNKIQVNDVLLVSTSLFPILNKNNPGDFDMKLYWEGKGVREMCFFQDDDFKYLDKLESSWFEKFMNSISYNFSKALENHLSGTELAIAKALVLGDKSLLDGETRNSFTATGAMHVLAVSGLHIGLILQLFLEFAKLFSKYISRKNAIITIVVILWIYALLTGFSPSVIRAVFMFTVLAISQLFGKNYSAMNNLFFTAFILLLFQPMFLFDIGFQLSYLAMVGIFLFNKTVTNWFTLKNKIANYIWQGTAVGFAAQFMTAPLTLYYFHQFPNYFALANIGLMAFSGAILGLGIALFIIEFVPILNAIVAFLLFLSVYLMFQFIVWVEHLPGAVAYGFDFPFGISVLITICFYFIVSNPPFKTKVWIASFGMLIASLSFVVFKRYENLQTNHICFFNNNQLVITIKKKSQIVCLYDSPVEKLDKIKMVISPYLKCYPGEVIYYSIYKKNTKIDLGKLHFELKKSDIGRTFKTNNFEKTVVFSNKVKLDVSSNYLFMPWIECKNTLSEGAKIFKFQE